MTINQIKAKLRLENPTLQSGNDQDGYVEITGEEYDNIIDNWADEIIAKQAKETAKEEAILAKAALLERLGITADEATLLIG
jgi:hypothetical protein